MAGLGSAVVEAGSDRIEHARIGLVALVVMAEVALVAVVACCFEGPMLDKSVVKLVPWLLY